MDREIYQSFISWKNKPDRKPLILKGARQVGKTYAVSEFAQKEFRHFFKLDFLKHPQLVDLFQTNAPAEIVQQLEFYFRKKIDPKKDLLFFDEIQECPLAITSLKYFYEELPEMRIICAGSYLGIMTTEDSFPVGKVEYLSMTPCTFKEFLAAVDADLAVIFDRIDIHDHNPIPPLYHEALLKNWRLYLALGGMPEVIKVYLKNLEKGLLEALEKARAIQEQLLEGYRSDFTKHSGRVNASHILHVFDSISQQLSKFYDESVGKFHFSGVIPKQKGFERIIGPLTWLTKASLVLKTFIVNKAEHPLKGFSEENKFKLYYLDVGLLQASLKIPMTAIMDEEIGSYKGYIVENFVAQELFHQKNDQLYSWSEGTAEIEFLYMRGKEILPLEVKSSTKSRRAKSLDSFIAKYAPPVAFKFTAQNRGYEGERKMLTLPLYLIGKLSSF